MKSPHKSIFKTFFWIVVLLVIVLLLRLVVNESLNNKKPSTDVIEDTPVGVTLSHTPKIIDKETSLYSLDITYPVFEGMTEGVNLLVNETLKTKIDIITNTFVDNVGTELVDSASEKSLLFIDYEVIDQVFGVSSVVLNVWEYYQGAAHGNPYAITFMFNVNSGKEVNLSDLFIPESKYLNDISRESKNLLRDALADWYDKDWVESGTEPTPENFQSFFLTHNSLVFIFDAYQVAPYAAGSFKIEIPLTVLGDFSLH